MKKIIGIIQVILSFGYCFQCVNAQDKMNLTLQEVIELAQKQSLDAFINKNLYLSSYWEYRAYKAERRPWLSVSSNPVNYSNSIESYSDSSGHTMYTNPNKIESDGYLNLSQNLALTGGKVYINSGLSRVQNFIDNGDITIFGTTPVSVGITQPLFQYNSYKWKKKIEPIKFEKAKQEYISSVEMLAYEAVRNFFNLLDAQQARDIAWINKTTADTFYQKSLGQYDLGAIALKDLQRLELNKLNSYLVYQNAELNLERVKFRLKSFLRINEENEIELVIPVNFPDLEIPPSLALDQAIQNNPDILEFQQRMLEADQRIAMTKGETGISSDLEVNLGWNNTSSDFNDLYNEFDKARNIRLSLYVPIVDWGLSKGRREMAKFNSEIVNARLEKERIEFEENILRSAIEYNMIEQQLKIVVKAKEIADKTYKTISDRFLLGKESLETLYAARNERDNALRNYYNKMREYWLRYYYMRSLTLYDFENNKSLSENFDKQFGL